MLLHSSFAVVFISIVAVSLVTDATGEQCQNAAELQNQLTCAITQATGTCGWIVYKSNSDLLWRIDASNKFIVIIKDTVYGIVQLRSPIICATNTGLSTLTFKYEIQNDNCEQSVFLDGGSCNTTLWSTNQSTNNAYVQSPNITIDNQIHNFHIVLQSMRLGDQYCQFKLHDIAFKYIGERNGSTLPSTDGTTPGITLPGAGSSGGGSPGGDSPSGGLSGGSIDGIIVSFVVVIAVLVIVFFLLRRRKTGGKLPFQKLFGRLRTVIQTETSPQNVSELDAVEVPNGQNIGFSETPHRASDVGSPTITRGECPYEDIGETGGTYYSALDHRGNTNSAYSSLQNCYENATGKEKEDVEGSYTQLHRPSPQTEL